MTLREFSGPKRPTPPRHDRNVHSSGRAARIDQLDAGLLLAGAGTLLAVSILRRGRRGQTPRTTAPAARHARDGAAILAGSVLADSALEHFRGGYHNPAMYVAPATAALEIGTSLAGTKGRGERAVHDVSQALSVAVGAAGLGFHLFNVLRRPGALAWNNLFYAAPLGAPGALIVAGLLNLGAERVEDVERGRDDAAATRNDPRRTGRLLAAFTGIATLGEVAEVALLHFRGAFHNPAMVLPLAIPPLSAAALLGQAVRPTAGTHRLARAATWATGLLGVIGTGFHVYGVSRNMGGWRNWRQTALAGPPVPAPSSFTGLALAGAAALTLIGRGGRR